MTICSSSPPPAPPMGDTTADMTTSRRHCCNKPRIDNGDDEPKRVRIDHTILERAGTTGAKASLEKKENYEA